MRSRNVELAVGLFMMAGFIAFVYLAMRVSGLAFDGGQEGYRVYARFENVGSLKPRSKVTLAGVEVGRVIKVSLDSEDFVAVVEIEINADVDNLSLDSSASIMTSGVLGEQYVALEVGAEEAYLAAGDEIEDTYSALVLEELVGKLLFNFK
ncbi:MAG: outer membrane lipid asymmetry maintenance protein MlaD [Gammaproteobacteria bacterium]|nr:MAG: outer membrane lipid asymmetry maintenance protein MlaD [Gammaproteobacteria bacterium]